MGGWVKLVVGMKEGTYCMEHWVLHVSHESWNTTSRTNDVLQADSHNTIKNTNFKREKENLCVFIKSQKYIILTNSHNFMKFGATWMCHEDFIFEVKIVFQNMC